MKHTLKALILALTIINLSLTSCSSEGDDTPQITISNVTFTPQSFQDRSSLLIQWNSTGASNQDEVIINIQGPGYQTQESSSGNSVQTFLPPNAYNFEFTTSSNQVLGSFSYTYNPMVYDINVYDDFSNNGRGVRFKFQDDPSFAQPSRFEIEYGIAGFSQGNGTTKSILNNINTTATGSVLFVASENIIPGEIHDFYVRNIYNETGASDWLGPYQVDYPSNYLACTTPDLQSVTIIQDFFGNPSSAEITFNAEGVDYQVSLVNNISSDPEDGNISNVGTTFAITQINANTDYYFALRSECFDGNYTEWSEVHTFNSGS